LLGQGYTIEATNWRKTTYEIDIVARKDNGLVMVEVKSSRSSFFDLPEVRVTRTKQKRLITAAWEYLSLLDWEPVEVRFDVIAITWPFGKSPEIRHIESAFTAEIYE
jgi:putative endonuclease